MLRSMFVAAFSLLLLVFLPGCAQEKGLLEKPVPDSPVERAKLITSLWERCREGVRKATGLDMEEYEGRELEYYNEVIGILQDSYPYGRRAFRLAPNSAERCTFWFARNATFLGWWYERLGNYQLDKAEKTGNQELKLKGNENRDKAETYLRKGIELFRHYKRQYFDRTRDRDMFRLLELSYRFLATRDKEHLQDAYLVLHAWDSELDYLEERGVNSERLKEERQYCRQAIANLKERMKKEFVPIPEVEE